MIRQCGEFCNFLHVTCSLVCRASPGAQLCRFPCGCIVQMGRGSIDHLMEIGWIKPSGRKNIPGKPALWVTTELFMEHFGIENISDLPSKEELKASGFLEKRSAIATITDIAGKNEFLEDKEVDDEETLEDFIPEESAK